jgi:hypothetical protein
MRTRYQLSRVAPGLVVCGICAENHVESGTVLDDNDSKLEVID